jgi:hypothetical protein
MEVPAVCCNILPVTLLNSIFAAKVRRPIFLCLVLLAAFGERSFAEPGSKPLQDAVILIIRHAEKPESGRDLSPEGVKRADAYVGYFKNFQADSKPLKLDYIFAAADSKGSRRPRLTVTPLSRALKLPVDTRFKDKDFQSLADDIRSTPHGKNILICWHHGEIPELVHALGADPAEFFPKGKWPGNVFGWLIELRYDHEGRLMGGKSKRINEHLMPGDVLPAADEP